MLYRHASVVFPVLHFIKRRMRLSDDRLRLLVTGHSGLVLPISIKVCIRCNAPRQTSLGTAAKGMTEDLPVLVEIFMHSPPNNC